MLRRSRNVSEAVGYGLFSSLTLPVYEMPQRAGAAWSIRARVRVALYDLVLAFALLTDTEHVSRYGRRQHY